MTPDSSTARGRLATLWASLLAVFRKELRQTFRDRRMVAVLVVAPVLQLTLLGYAVDLDVDRIPTVITDHDRSPRSRALVSAMLADGTLLRVAEASDPEPLIKTGKAQVAVVIPAGLGRDLDSGRAVQVQVLVDGTDSIRAQVAVDTCLRHLQRFGLEMAHRRLEQASALRGAETTLPGVRVQPRIYYNPSMRSPMFMVPGVAALVLLVVTTLVTAMGLAREREMGTIEQLLVTPIRPVVLLLGKTLPFAFIGMLVAGLVLAVGTNLFSVPVRGPLSVIFVGTLLYLMTTLGVGIFISTLARTQQQAILGGIFFLLPALLLSGFTNPVESMPGWIQTITLFNPVRYYVEILRACLLKGAGFADLARQLWALAAFGAAILGLATLRFRKRVA